MLRARSVSSGCFIGSVLTPVGVRTPRGLPPPTARPALPRPPPPRFFAGGRIVDVLDAIGRAPIALQLRLDPVDGCAISIGSLAAITELGQPFDGRLVFLEVETIDERLDRIGRLALREHPIGRARDNRAADEGKDDTHGRKV